MIIFITIVWILYAASLGNLEAYHYFMVNKISIDPIDEHPKFTGERFLVWVLATFAMHTQGETITWLNGFCLPFLFVMIHDGVYYEHMNELNGAYPKKFWDFSLTSKAWSDRAKLTTPVKRVVYFIIGILGLLIINIYG